jgi:hypothetical protein
MQVSATVIAAQQAAREARAALLAPKPQAAASFLSELNEAAPAAAKHAPAPAPVKTDTAPAPMRPGSLVNIII